MMPRDATLSRPAGNPPTRLLVRVSGTLDTGISRAPRMRIRSVPPLTGTPDLGVPTPQVAARRPEDEHRDAARVARGQSTPVAKWRSRFVTKQLDGLLHASRRWAPRDATHRSATQAHRARY